MNSFRAKADPRFLSVRDITLEVNGIPALEHTSLDILKGEHWAALGPTGGGKTLLADALSRRVSISKGQIVYFFDESSSPEGRPYVYPREILTLSSETHRDFLARYSGYHQARWQSMEGENVPSVREMFRAAPDGFPAGHEDLFDMLGLESLLDRKLLHLSHGESRKVHVAYLLLQSPRMLILDDPFAGLDSPSRERLAAAIEDLLLRETPRLFFISSRPEEVPREVQQVLLIDRLRVRDRGDRDTVVSKYRQEGAEPVQLPGAGLAPALDRALKRFSAVLEANRSPANELVRMEAVSVAYGPVRVLEGVSWRVARGERWSVSGPNGAGKTTLLSLILADNPQAYASEIYLFGRRRGTGESIWEIKRHIGWVSPELHMHYPLGTSCLEVVSSGFFDSVGLYRHCASRQLEEVQIWMEALGLSAWAETAFHGLSTGQQRLALLARALVKDPPLLILDEPCQGLDAAHRQEIMNLLDGICRNTELTVLFVTHYPDELPGSITHQLRLEDGRVTECGPRKPAPGSR